MGLNQADGKASPAISVYQLKGAACLKKLVSQQFINLEGVIGEAKAHWSGMLVRFHVLAVGEPLEFVFQSQSGVLSWNRRFIGKMSGKFPCWASKMERKFKTTRRWCLSGKLSLQCVASERGRHWKSWHFNELSGGMERFATAAGFPSSVGGSASPSGGNSISMKFNNEWVEFQCWGLQFVGSVQGHSIAGSFHRRTATTDSCKMNGMTITAFASCWSRKGAIMYILITQTAKEVFGRVCHWGDGSGKVGKPQFF